MGSVCSPKQKIRKIILCIIRNRNYLVGILWNIQRIGHHTVILIKKIFLVIPQHQSVKNGNLAETLLWNIVFDGFNDFKIFSFLYYY
jgi:hypothetical protein